MIGKKLLFSHASELRDETSPERRFVATGHVFKCLLLQSQDYVINTQPFPKRQILDSSKLKEFADDNIKFGNNGRKFFKQVENAEGKGEIARYEQFLLFQQCFQKTCTADT